MSQQSFAGKIASFAHPGTMPTQTAEPAVGESHGLESVRKAPWLFPLLGVFLVTATYARVTRMGFVYDDLMIVKGNTYIQSAEYIPRYFTEHIWTELMAAEKNYYRPAFLLWLLGNYSLFRENPLGWHLTSLLLHLGNVLLVYFLALRLTRVPLAALAASLVFGLHPAQVETVSWVSASTELLGSFLALAAFLFYLRSLESPERRMPFLAVSLLLYAIATLAKETVLILPAIVFLHEWFGRPACGERALPLRRGALFHAAFQESATFGLVAAAYLAARIYVLGGLGHSAVALTARVWLLTLPRTLCSYLVHLLWPAGLSAFYDSAYVVSYSAREVLLPLTVVFGAALLLVLAVWKSSAAKLAAFWLLLPLLLVLDIRVFPRNEYMHDRYLYQPLIGVALLVGIGVAYLSRLWAGRRDLRVAVFAVTAGTVAALGAATFRQTNYWIDNFALYTRGVAVAPHNGFANCNLGAVLLESGEWDPAMGYFRLALQSLPTLYLAQYDLGFGYYEKGRYAEAEAAFRRSLELNPYDAGTYFFLGLTLLHTDRLPLAIAAVRRAISLKPSGFGFHFALGAMLKQAGDLPGARAEFEAELKRDPHHQPSLEQLRLVEEQLAKAAAGK